MKLLAKCSLLTIGALLCIHTEASARLQPMDRTRLGITARQEFDLRTVSAFVVTSAIPVELRAGLKRGNSIVKYEIQSTLNLANGLDHVIATVTNDTVDLTGYVDSYGQSEAAASIAKHFARNRRVENDITIGGIP